MATTCAKYVTPEEAKKIKGTLAEDDFSIGEYPNPWDNPANIWTEWKIYQYGKLVKINQKIISGPDEGVHRFIYVRDFYNTKGEQENQAGGSGSSGITEERNGRWVRRQHKGKK